MLEKEIKVACQAALEAGKILVNMSGKLNNIHKKGDIDLVTDADLRSEKKVIEIITDNFPQDSILAEESGAQNRASDRVWVIDPLDGTTNFAHGFPAFAVSIALEIRNENCIGVVYNPATQELFEAVKDNGTLLNKKPITVSNTDELGESLLATGFPYYIREQPQRTLELLSKFIVRAQGLRRAGSAALDLCHLAAGRFDGFWEEGLKPWDTAAGSIIVTEAGGILSDYQGKDYNSYKDTIIASNGHIHKTILKIIQTYEG